jgi:hypothetical protein
MLDQSSSKAVIDQSIKMPDYFSCNECAAKPWQGERCDEFQAAGRCRAAMLGQALQSGAVQVTLYLPVGK